MSKRHCYASYGVNDRTCGKPKGHAGKHGSGRRSKRKCPLHGTCENVGTITMWGCVTHKNLVRVCAEHEEIYRMYGWIRARRQERER